MNTKVISIIGGHGQMGTLFRQLWQNQGYEVHAIGRKDLESCDKILTLSAAVIICVPIKDTTAMIAKLAPRLNKSTILADFTSLKVEPLMTMLAEYSGPVLGLHPMFGPTIHAPHNQIIVHCQGRNPDAC